MSVKICFSISIIPISRIFATKQTRQNSILVLVSVMYSKSDFFKFDLSYFLTFKAQWGTRLFTLS